MITAIWIIGTIMLYFVGFGITATILGQNAAKEGKKLDSGDAWLALLWPITLPAFFGGLIVCIVTSLFKKDKKDKKE